MRHCILTRTLLMVALLLLCVSVISGAETLSIQGVLKDAGGIPLSSGSYAMRFSLLNVASSGSALWTEDHTDANAVAVLGGHYSAIIGGITPFPSSIFSANPDLWLEITVDTDASGTFEAAEIFSPRIALCASAYAFQATNATTLEGQSASAFAPITHAHDASEITGIMQDAQVADNLTISSGGAINGEAIKSGIVGETYVDVEIARDAEVATMLTSHTLVQNAHHTWPLTDADIPNDITILGTGIVSGTAIKVGTVDESRIDDAIARDSELEALGVGCVRFDAVVAPSGGDYTSLEGARAAGKNTIFVRNGTYTLSDDVECTNGTVIIGESRHGVVIDCDSWNNIIAKSGDITYTSGTISVSNDSEFVTGNGTYWLSAIQAGERINLADAWYEIMSVDSDNQLTLGGRYKGVDINNSEYSVCTLLTNVYIGNLTIKNCRNTNGAIGLNLVIDSAIENCTFLYYGTSSGFNGLDLTRAYNCTISNNSIQNYSFGISLYLSYNNIIRGNSITNCGNYGIDIGRGENNVLIGNICNAMNTGIHLDVAPHNSISNNICLNSETSGIIVYGSEHCIITGNICRNNLRDGIDISQSENAIVSNNICTDNREYGIDIHPISYNAIISSNQLLNNTLGAGRDNSATAIKANNYPAF